jgi:DNA modification methylase
VKALARNQVLIGDAAAVLASLLPESVDCVITSPPYPAKLRDYGAAGQLGQEPTIHQYLRNLRAVLRGIDRVLKPGGSLWLNLGDSYARTPGVGAPLGSLLLAPQRLALLIAAEGFLVRNVVTWAKPNPLPQSAHDRLSPTTEVIIFATKGRRYFFDLDAIRIPHRTARKPAGGGGLYQGGNDGLMRLRNLGLPGNERGKNPGDVWEVATAVDRLGHQATFPEALIERPILATCPERICVQCDMPWTRPTRIITVYTSEGRRDVRKVGELQRCDCFAPSRAGVVLDPFFGTGTVGVVAERLGRDWLGIELNPNFAVQAEQRIAKRRAA